MNERTESPEMNRRICLLIMRGLSAAEATEQARLESAGRDLARRAESNLAQRRSVPSNTERLLGKQ